MATEDARSLADMERNAVRLSEQLSQVGGEYSSTSGVSVNVDAGGRVTDLRLSESLAVVSPPRLASMILDATKQARQNAEQRAAVILSEFKSDPTFERAVAMIEGAAFADDHADRVAAVADPTWEETRDGWMERP